MAPTCPHCGATFTIDTHAETEDIILRQAPRMTPYRETVRRPVVVAFCNGCEFAIELKV